MTEDGTPDANKINWFPYILVVAALIIIGIVVLSSNSSKRKSVETEKRIAPDISKATYHRDKPGVADIKVTLPHQDNKLGSDIRFSYSFTLNHKAGAPAMYNIIADDCVNSLIVNGKEVKLTGKAHKNSCNWRDGFHVDLAPYLKEGANTILINAWNRGGPAGLAIYVDNAK